MSTRILIGDVREKLAILADGSVHCCVTSPPYFGLRDYGVDGQIGLEATPADFVAVMVEVFREVRRVLHADGTCWINLGDSYANDGKWGGATGGKHVKALHDSSVGRGKRTTGLKPKDLIGIPWRVAFALQDDGWYLRQDIIWHKPNPMPESVTDRCTKAHEYLFLLTKSPRYYFDQAAIAEPSTGWHGSQFDIGKTGEHQLGRSQPHRVRKDQFGGNKHNGDTTKHSDGSIYETQETRNKRSVWTVSTQPYKEAHFATFPPELIEPCIKAGCPVGGTVLDPFFGAGTTGLVSDRLGRDCIGIELNPEYAAIAEDRIRGDNPMFAKVAAE